MFLLMNTQQSADKNDRVLFDILNAFMVCCCHYNLRRGRLGRAERNPTIMSFYLQTGRKTKWKEKLLRCLQ